MACGLTPELARMLSELSGEKERAAADAKQSLADTTRQSAEAAQRSAKAQKAARESALSGEYDWTRTYDKWSAWEDPEDLAMREQQARERSERAEQQARMGGCDHDHSAEQKLMDMSTDEKLRACDEFRRLGNALFAQGQFQRAAFHYHKAIVYFEYVFPDTEDEEARMEQLKLKVLLNFAACRLKPPHVNTEEAIHHADQALQIDAANVKALFRRAQARRLRDEFELAAEDLERAVELSGGKVDAALAQEKTLLQARVLAYKLRSKHVSAAMFGSSNGCGRQEQPTKRSPTVDVMEIDLLKPRAASKDEVAFESWQPCTRGMQQLEALAQRFKA